MYDMCLVYFCPHTMFAHIQAWLQNFKACKYVYYVRVPFYSWLVHVIGSEKRIT